MVSVPVVAFARRMASRKLQSLATPLQAFVIGEAGVGSSVRFTVNVGSGSGIIADGATCPWCSATIPGRVSTFTRIANPAKGAPLYGRVETTPGTKSVAPVATSGWAMIVICPALALRIITSSAP